MPKGKRQAEDDIPCCESPPPTCPRRYCAILMNALEEIGGPLQSYGSEGEWVRRGQDTPKKGRKRP